MFYGRSGASPEGRLNCIHLPRVFSEENGSSCFAYSSQIVFSVSNLERQTLKRVNIVVNVSEAVVPFTKALAVKRCKKTGMSIHREVQRGEPVALVLLTYTWWRKVDYYFRNLIY